MKFDDNSSKYLNIVPDVVRTSIRPLTDDANTIIFGYLMENGESSFSEILKALRLDNNTLNRALLKLVEGGLVERHLRKNKEVNLYSYYKSTLLGNLILKKLIEANNEILFGESLLGITTYSPDYLFVTPLKGLTKASEGGTKTIFVSSTKPHFSSGDLKSRPKKEFRLITED